MTDQEALLAAAEQWPGQGTPENPRAWLITVASRRLTDLLRNEQARRRREDTVARWALPEEWLRALYEVLLRLRDNPVVALNHAVAVAMVDGPTAGLALCARLQDDERITGDHRWFAVRAHLFERAGDLAAAREAYREAASRTSGVLQRRYLTARAARLTDT